MHHVAHSYRKSWMFLMIFFVKFDDFSRAFYWVSALKQKRNSCAFFVLRNCFNECQNVNSIGTFAAGRWRFFKIITIYLNSFVGFQIIYQLVYRVILRILTTSQGAFKCISCDLGIFSKSLVSFTEIKKTPNFYENLESFLISYFQLISTLLQAQYKFWKLANF